MEKFPADQFVCSSQLCGNAAAVLCINAAGYQWLACDKKNDEGEAVHQVGAEKTEALADWWERSRKPD